MESTPGRSGPADRPSSPLTRSQGRSRRRHRLRRGRLRRELAVLEASLAAQTPRLAAQYETFNLLHGGPPPAGPPDGAEPPRAPLWRRPRFAGIVTLAVLALVVALCATLSVELRPAAPSCLTAASAPAATTAAAAQLRALDCGGYPANTATDGR